MIIVNSVCVTNPSYIKVTSGSDDLGEFQTTDEISINPNLNSDPLKIDFVFTNTQNNCFNNKEDLKFKLFSTAIETPADSFSTQNVSGKIITTFSVVKQTNLQITNTFVSTFLVTNSANQQYSGSILFSPDNDAPFFEIFAIQPTNPLISSNEQITINYRVVDSGTGLSLITINGPETKIIPFNGRNNSYDGQIQEYLSNTGSYTITAKDKLGKTSMKTTSFVVDNQAPLITNVEKNYEYDSTRRVSFKIRIEDVSFLYTNDAPRVIGNFSFINPSFSSYLGTCLRLTNSSYECTFNNIEITSIDKTQNVLVKFNLSDSLDNSRIQSFNEEIFVDNEGPKITDFYLENSLGVKNIFSSKDDNITVHLKFNDESLSQREPRIFTNFDLIQFPQGSCTYTGNNGECTWRLGNISSLYANMNNISVPFKVTILDYYSNSNSDSFVALLDNNFPILTTIEIIETESIKDKILKSGEKINFRVFIEDENLLNGGEYFVKGDFSNIDFRDNMNNVNGLCSSFNQNIIQCDFNSIILENGYIKRNVTFEISDIAGNTIKKNKEIEIFQVSNEVFSSYKIGKLKILNPLNRNQIVRGGGTAWFEGKLDLMGAENISLINYQIVSCAEEELDPLLVIDYQLFPDPIVINSGQKNVENFAMKVNLKDHQNLNDLNTKKMTCKMSVLKKDSKTVYAPEIVNFELEFSFYNVPRGDLLEANAKKILAMYDDISYLGDWFDTTYGFYSLFSSACSAVNSAGGTLNAFVEIKNILQAGLLTCDLSTGGSCTGNIGKYSESSKDSIMKPLTDGFIKKACDWVTCRNGAHLTGLLTGAFDSSSATEELGLGETPLLGDLIKGYNSLCREGGVALFDEKGKFSETLK